MAFAANAQTELKAKLKQAQSKTRSARRRRRQRPRRLRRRRANKVGGHWRDADDRAAAPPPPPEIHAAVYEKRSKGGCRETCQMRGRVDSRLRLFSDCWCVRRVDNIPRTRPGAGRRPVRGRRPVAFHEDRRVPSRTVRSCALPRCAAPRDEARLKTTLEHKNLLFW